MGEGSARPRDERQCVDGGRTGRHPGDARPGRGPDHHEQARPGAGDSVGALSPGCETPSE